MQDTTIGLDLAKNVFQVHGISDNRDIVFNRALRRAQVLTFFKKLVPCLVGIEACSTSHHWAREISKLGHDVKLIPPVYVKPYVKRGKSDAVDAEAICEVVTRPTMRFVEIKTPEPQAISALPFPDVGTLRHGVKNRRHVRFLISGPISRSLAPELSVYLVGQFGIGSHVSPPVTHFCMIQAKHTFGGNA